MKFSVVIPSLNQSEFLEDCLKSVISEKIGHNLEIIVMDGGSTDGSIDIIKKFSKYIDYWRSHSDEGQTSAIAEGFAKCKGDYITWLNSDDCWEKGVLNIIEQAVKKYKSDLIIGDTKIIDSQGNIIKFCRAKIVSIKAMVIIGDGFSQPSVFFSKYLYISTGALRRDLECAFDHDLFLRMLSKTKPLIIHKCFSRFRLHGQNKTIKLRNTVNQELQCIHRNYTYSKYSIISKEILKMIYRVQCAILDRYGAILHRIKKI